MSSLPKISANELRMHAHDTDAWMALNGVVWDFSGFSSKHPGGDEIITKHLGKDGSKVYNEIHSPGLVLRHLGEEKRLGEMEAECSGGSAASLPKDIKLPDVQSITNLLQFEEVAETAMTEKAWFYVSGATEDGITNDANKEYFRHIMFRPRVLRGVGVVDLSVSFLEHRLSCPIFVAPTSSVKLTHPGGEVAIARASEASGVPPIIPSMSSFSMSEIVDALTPGYPFFFQLYVHRDRVETERLLDQACQLNARAIMVTVDLPVLSKREVEKRQSSVNGRANKVHLSRQSAPPPANTIIDPELNWDTIQWIIKRTGLPVFVKGVQHAEDALHAFKIGCAGIYLSNHGGRALDTASPALLVLLEIRKTCPAVLRQMEVVIDGGIRRGSDVLKAICLGASAVCIGRPFLYALSYGEKGIIQAYQILKTELQIAMQLVGITSLDEAHPGYLNTAALDALLPSPNCFSHHGLERRALKL